MTTTKKTTLATIKSFIRKNLTRKNNWETTLFINVKRRYDGMQDGCMDYTDGWNVAQRTIQQPANTLNVKDAWFVLGSRNYFERYEDQERVGYDIQNCCGHFLLAIEKKYLTE